MLLPSCLYFRIVQVRIPVTTYTHTQKDIERGLNEDDADAAELSTYWRVCRFDCGVSLCRKPPQYYTLTVLNPFRTPEAAAVQDTDFAGPLVFCLTFGAILLLSGKVHFSFIYGMGVMGCLMIWALLSLMSTTGVSLGIVVTVLGYCILPMVVLSGVNVVLSLQGYIGTVLASAAIGWCSLSASKLFVTALAMEHQQPLVMYPCALLYGVFALITIF